MVIPTCMSLPSEVPDVIESRIIGVAYLYGLYVNPFVQVFVLENQPPI